MEILSDILVQAVESPIMCHTTAQAVKSPALGLTMTQAVESPISHCGGLGSVSVPSMWDLWWTWQQRVKIFSEYFGVQLSRSFYQCTALIN
jgi:hypothetical protein